MRTSFLLFFSLLSFASSFVPVVHSVNTMSLKSSAAADDSSPMRKRDKIKKKASDLLHKLQDNPLVPAVALFAVGYKIGTKSVKVIQQTEKTTQVATRTSTPAALTLVLSLVAAREIWRIIPQWLKKQIPYLGRRYTDKEQVDENDMSSVVVITNKLRALFNVMSGKLENGESGIEIAFLALLQLMGQVKSQEPSERDESYQKARGSTLVEDPVKELKGLEDLFEFADYAYDELQEDMTLADVLKKSDYTLLRHDTTILPGSVAHYVAISKSRKTALIGVKGTSSFEDMLTDICGNTIEYELDEPFVSGGPTKLTCHEGIMTAAVKLADDMEELVEELLLPNGYKLLITGHSLGAGVASLIGLLLRSRIPELRQDDSADKLKVYAFASPPVLGHDAALACKPFVTTVVNNSDIIPRSSISNLLVTAEFLKVVNNRLKEKGMMPKDLKSSAAFFRSLTKGTEGEMLMDTKEIFEELSKAFDKVELEDPTHLYVPGRVLHMVDMWSKEGYNKEEEEIETKKDGAVTGETRNGVLYGGAFEVPEGCKTAEILLEGDGTSNTLRFIELDSRMMTDHLSPGYRSSLRSFLGTASTTKGEAAAKEMNVVKA